VLLAQLALSRIGSYVLEVKQLEDAEVGGVGNRVTCGWVY
jgi:hypothetical protein